MPTTLPANSDWNNYYHPLLNNHMTSQTTDVLAVYLQCLLDAVASSLVNHHVALYMGVANWLIINKNAQTKRDLSIIINSFPPSSGEQEIKIHIAETM